MKSVLELIQPERAKIEKEISLSKDLIAFHTLLAEKQQKKLDDQELKMKALDLVLEKIMDLYQKEPSH